MEKLKELIDGLVTEKSLSFEVLEQVRKVKETSDELIKTNTIQGEQLLEFGKKEKNLLEEISILSKEISGWKVRESSLIEREKAVLDIEHENEIEKLKAKHSSDTLKEVKEVVGMVFKNTVLRESVIKTPRFPFL